jgi:hypothetical protein
MVLMTAGLIAATDRNREVMPRSTGSGPQLSARYFLVAMLTLSLIAPQILGAQALADVQIGVRLRVRTTAGARIEGELASLTPDTLRLHVLTRGAPTAVPLAWCEATP